VKIKLDENLPARLVGVFAGHGHDVHTVQEGGLVGRPDGVVWQAANAEGRLLVTQDLDFSDSRRFQPGTHAGLLLVRLREPGANEPLRKLAAVAGELSTWAGCFVVLTDHKIRVKRP
jgi:predicted nuclease of predicted toxin-antitoxin system